MLLILSTVHYSLTLNTHNLDRITALVCLYMYLRDGDFVGCEIFWRVLSVKLLFIYC